MKILVSMLLLGITNLVFAESFFSKVVGVDYGVGDEPHFIRFENAKVAFLDGEAKNKLPFFEKSMIIKDDLEVETDDRNGFVRAKSIIVNKDIMSVEHKMHPEEMISYEPTVLKTNEEVATIFRRMRRDYQNKSQCFNRAHVWTSEEFKRSGFNSMKVFLFFTARYIRSYRYGWWFHVSPMAKMQEDGVVINKVLDRRYSSGPEDIKVWLKKFIYSGRNCPVVEKYADYRDNQYKEDCYLIPVSMYFWQPRDIEARDASGTEKTEFLSAELKTAYWEAF